MKGNENEADVAMLSIRNTTMHALLTIRRLVEHDMSTELYVLIFCSLSSSTSRTSERVQLMSYLWFLLLALHSYHFVRIS